MLNTVRGRLMASSALFGAAMMGSVALAQTADAPVATAQPSASQPAFGPPTAAPPTTNASGDKPSSVSEVVVTGSRIRSTALTSTSPLTVVGSQEFKNIGATNVEQVLNELPSVTAAQSSGLSGLSNGIATVNLRDLGAIRTLVLVNGRRLMPGDPTGANGLGPVADINIIPTQLVERVEVVTGGASAVYGSDAVAGVVNFIMKKNFQGVEFDVNENFAEHDNNNTAARAIVAASGFQEAPAGNQLNDLGLSANALFGINSPDGKGNITGYVGYRQLEPILESKYDYSACTVSAAPGKSTVATIYAGHACGGSSNGLYGRFDAFNPDQISAFGLAGNRLHDNPDGSQSFVTSSVPSYNYGATNYFQRSETRYTGGYFANYEVNPMLNLYSEFMFDDDQTVGQIAPSGLFAGTGANGNSYMNINCNNPLLSASQQAQLCGSAAGTPSQVQYLIGYRFGSFPRDYGYEHLDYKIDIGAKGQLSDVWSYDIYGQYGTSKLSNLLLNDTSTTHLQNALLVDPTTGQCLSGGACVPLNIFKAGGVTQAAFNYVSVPAFQTGETVEQIVSASVNGELGKYGLKSPFADEGVGVAFGTEYRREYLNFTPDVEYQTKDLSGTSPTLPDQGSFDVYEIFGEFRIPLAQNRPFVKDLTFDGGYRFSDYSTAGVTNTYKAQLEYAPIPDIRFRGGYNRAVRAPNVVELFKPTTVALFGGEDPCVGAKPSAPLASCVASGLPANLYGNFTLGCPAGQCGDLAGGNTALKPEEADTYTGGLVFTPTMPWAQGFTASIDYFNIYIQNLITTVPATVSVANCANGDLTACSTFFHRDPSSHILFGQNGYVSALNVNSGFERTDGIDVEANYRRRLSDFGLPDYGVIGFNLITTYTNSLVTQPVSGGGAYNCAGLYGLTCGVPLPKIRGKFRATYSPPTAVPVTMSAQWRYVGPVHLDANRSNPLLTNHYYGITDTADNGLHSFSYLDLTASVKLYDRVTFNFGCNNVLDKDPPSVDSGSFVGAGAAAGNGNTYPGVYDTLGRSLFVELTADF